VNGLWSYFWPVFAAGLLAGAIAGSIAFRLPRMRSRDRIAGEPAIIRDWRRKRVMALGLGIAVSVAAAALWHGPLGAADRFTSRVERDARATLDFYLPQVRAGLHHGPLTRQLILTGPANDFQRSELVRTMETLPGVRSATWSASGGGLPLIVEGAAAAGLGFLFGLLFAYLVELRRRYNAQWTW
jgi:hypothetical protein